ncbi:MAG: CcmD family protein [Bacteroidetes bacterium]|nr:CcmD family protein [Bacteroidota bacterium]
MIRIKGVKKIIIILGLLISMNLWGQQKIKISEGDYNNKSVDMADKFREDGKIYVVVGVLAIILTGMILYIFFIDRRLQQMEKLENNQKN